MSPPINLVQSPIEIKLKSSDLKSINKRVSLTNLNLNLSHLDMNESRLSLDDKYLANHNLDDLKSSVNNNNSSAKTLNENFTLDDHLDDEMIGLGSLSSTGSNTDSLKRELEELSLKNQSCLNRSTSRADTGIGSDLLSNISTSPLPQSNNLTNHSDERNNSISTSDDLSDFDLVNEELNINKFKIINDITVIYPMNLSSDNEDDDADTNRRDTIVFDGNNKPKRDRGSKTNLNIPSNSSSQSFACEVASLSSMYSNYSQFDFVQSKSAPSPPPAQSHAYTTDSVCESSLKKQETPSNSGLSTFLGLFGNKKQENSSTTPNKFDLLTSKLFSFTQKPTVKQQDKQTTTINTHSSNKSSSSTSVADLQSFDNSSIKTNHSIGNLNSADLLQVPNTVLIFENRPSNLPAKSQQEALKHRQEYEKMVEIAKKKEQKENELKLKKHQQQMKKEDFMANSLKIWNNEIIPHWNEQNSLKRTQQLWWHGLPPSIRGKVWKLAIGNELELSNESYYFYEKKAKQKIELLSKYEPDSNDKTHESSVELIKLDVSRTFPQLCFFQKDGPYHEALHNVLGAYACYNSQIGYVQGMSFLTAILLLNMEAIDAFICLANLLDTKILKTCFCMDQAKMNRYFRVHQILLEYNIPKLYRHFEEQNVKPDLYLIDWIFTLFSKSLPLDVMSRVWDVFFRDKEEFLFRTALAILNLYKETLMEMDFIHVVQFLTKLPENINSTQLFKSIEQITMCIDDITFENLVSYST